MATAIEEDKRAKRTGPAGFVPGVDVAAPLNVTAPGTMAPDKPAVPAPVATQPAPQFARTNAGPMLQPPPTAAPVVPAVNPEQAKIANQTAMYVQGAQAAAAARPPVSTSVVPPAAGMNPAAAAQAVDPMAGQAAFVPPRMGVKPASPAATPEPGQGAWQPSQAMRDALPATAQAADEARANVTGAFKDGNIASGIGQLARGLVVAPAMAAVESGANLLSAAGDMAGAVLKPVAQAGYSAVTGSNEQLFDGKPAAAPAAPAGTAVTPPKPVAQVAPAPAPVAAPVAAPPVAPSAQPQPAADTPQSRGFTQVGDNIYRKGNSFTDEAGTRGAPRAGMVSVQNDVAAANLAGANQQALARLQAGNAQPAGFTPNIQMPSVKTSANDWQTRTDLRNLRVSANSLTNEPRWGGMGAKSPDVIAYEKALETDNALKQGKNPMAQEMLQQQGNLARTQVQDAGATQRAAMGEQGANTRAAMTNDVQQGELGLKREAQGFTARAAQRLEAAQASYDSAKTDEERAAAAKRIRAMQGKGEDVAAKDRYITTGGGQEFDVDAKSIVTRPQRIYDTQTRQFVDGAPAQAASLPPKEKLVKGVVYDTPKGRGTWDGKNFIPVQQ